MSVDNPGFELNLCKHCVWMTNHLDGVCQKHAPIEDNELHNKPPETVQPDTGHTKIVEDNELRKQLIAFDNADRSTDAAAFQAFRDIERFINAHTTRKETEARLDEIKYLDDNYQEDAQDWERAHTGFTTAMIPMESYVNRRKELEQQLNETKEEAR